MLSLQFNRSSVVLVLILVLTLPAMALQQKARPRTRKVSTPTGAFPSELVYAVTTTNVLISFNSGAPGTILSNVAITGLQAGENILGIDFRPVTRQLYALGSTSRLYRINLATGVATIVGSQFTPALIGTAFGFDFNPLVDRIRVTSDADQNFRLNPDNGAVAVSDINIAYAAGDPNVGFDPSAVGSAYTNNFVGATTTTLYDIDSNRDTLVIQNPPNGGTLNTVGSLGVDTTDLVGFDISRVSSTAFASLTTLAATSSGFYVIDLSGGAATLVGTIGGGVTIRGISVVPTALAGDLLISEFRLRGPGGQSDEFVEIYNPSTQPLTVATFDGSSGFSLAASDGVARFTIPNGTVIPGGGHYLGVNSLGYTLAGYPAGNGTTATGDATYTFPIIDNAGIALFNTSNPAGFNALNRLDAVGSATEANGLYKEGSGYPALADVNLEYSFFRNLKSGLPQDTNVNFAAAETAGATPQNDFVFADTLGTATPAGQRLGAPGPENLSSPIQRNATIKASLAFPCVSSSLSPNRIRNGTGNSGTLEIRRKFTNNTGSPVTRLRFRIVDMTTLPAPAGVADLRAISVPGSDLVADPCTAAVTTFERLLVEVPPAQAAGSGFNATLTAGTITAAAPIAPGASINVNFILGIFQAGSFRFFVNVEALP